MNLSGQAIRYTARLFWNLTMDPVYTVRSYCKYTAYLYAKNKKNKERKAQMPFEIWSN